MRSKNVLLTGGAGFIGSNLARHLLEAGAHVYNLDALTYAGDRANLPDHPRHHFIEGDICDAPLIAQIMQDHAIDTIMHTAAESHVDRSIAGPAVFIQTNLVGTFTLLEAARSHGARFHHMSTDEVYGSLGPDDPPATEAARYLPNSPYSASKAGSDHLVRSYFHTFRVPVTVTNCTNNYGPYQHPEKFIPTVIRSCFEQRPIPIYGNGSNIRDWLHVDDHCRAVLAVLENGRVGETYNVGSGTGLSNLELASLICETMDELHPRESSHLELRSFVEDRKGHDWRYAVDCTKIQQELGWRPEREFKQGLRQTIEFYRSRL